MRMIKITIQDDDHEHSYTIRDHPGSGGIAITNTEGWTTSKPARFDDVLQKISEATQ